MNILDFLLGVAVFCLIGFYGFKIIKKRQKQQAPTEAAAPNIQPPYQPPFLQQIPSYMPYQQTAAPVSIKGVKFCHINEYPFAHDSNTTVDDRLIELSLLTSSVNLDISGFKDSGYTVTSVIPVLTNNSIIVFYTLS